MEQQNNRWEEAPAAEDPHDGLQLAMVYALMQKFRDLYEPEAALVRGTLFAELDKPLETGGYPG